MQRDVFASISPLDHRYYASSQQLFDQLSEYLSENAFIRYQARVEEALAKILARKGLCSEQVAQEISRAARNIVPEEVYKEERITRHNIRALVNTIQAHVSDAARPFVHFTATSVDIMDTARAVQYRDVSEKMIIPQLKELLGLFIAITRREADAVQIGRTHGQHAVPITFGFAMAEYVSRLGNRIQLIINTSRTLRGKMAGAVGAYNASSLFFPDPEEFEREVLAELGLKPATHSTQIVEPEYLTDWAHALVSTLGVLANFGDDVRHLQRTEIGEVGEAFEAGQVGSSTMPHKRNPWNFEHVKSIWKAFAPHMLTLYMDQISEHQRDLTNSASSRFVPEIASALVAVTHRLNRVCSKLVIDRSRMMENLNMQKAFIIAEPLYILLAYNGHPDAHEAIRRLTLVAERTGKTLVDLVAESEELAPYLARMTGYQRQVLERPETYIGIASRKALQVADYWEAALLKQ
ncbi:MAG TPA: adenylosuccinate lyase [Firmicutes bacterium]|jgi:adenylosuccinate lyase|nr:adenylosuccinate lyase [Bacillota bacterium]